VQQQQVEQSRQRWNGERGNWNRGDQTQQVEQSRQRWSGDRTTWSGRSGDYRQQQVIQQQVQNRSRWANNNGSRWNRDWRSDRRYDWRGYRNSHRSIFHIGAYFDPFGYGYQQFDIGYQLQPVYFGQQYWIDPAMYSLPYPPPGTTWVRYWNDAVLVDMYSGQVVDVIHDFFW
jgi:Ni/Co efflux regulator RcnB